MGEFDPVSWEVAERALGAPAAEITAMVEEMAGEVSAEPPYEAVKEIHDALSEGERTVPNPGEPFVTAYLLEREAIITPNENGDEYRSLVARRPNTERLRELFWDRERTLWWIGLLTGVHPSLVTYWCYEADVPLMERNYGEESMARIRAERDVA